MILLLVVTSFVLFGWLGSLQSCNLPIKYSIGNVDPKFKLSDSEVLTIAKDAEIRWDNALGKNILEYDPNAPMKINLIYDQRQTEVDNLKSEIAKLDSSSNSLNDWSSKIDTIISNYEIDLNNYNSRLNNYNNQVNYWNMMGGAPSYTYYSLQNEGSNLDILRNNLEARRQNIIKMANLLDSESAKYNSDLEKLKGYMDQNKNKLITQGLYYTDGNKIDIFTFWDSEELRLVLMHELGHSFGIDHDQGSSSIMYSVLGDQNLSNPQPSQEDIQLVDSKCNIK